MTLGVKVALNSNSTNQPIFCKSPSCLCVGGGGVKSGDCVVKDHPFPTFISTLIQTKEKEKEKKEFYAVWKCSELECIWSFSRITVHFFLHFSN